MNTYMEMQIRNMIMYLNTFQRSCELAAQKDDGRIDKAEEKQLAKIKAAVTRFQKDLEKI